MHYLNPKNHFLFYLVFDKRKHLCISLINSMLPLEKPIIDIEYQTGEQIPELKRVLYTTLVSVRCTDSDNRQFIVNIQLYTSASFKYMIALDASKPNAVQLRNTPEFELHQPVYALCFLTDDFLGTREKSPKMKDEYCHYYNVVNFKDSGKQIEGLVFLYIELSKFKPQNRTQSNAEAKKMQELWLRFLTEIDEDTTEAPKDLLDNEITREAVGYLEKYTLTKEQLNSYYRYKIDAMTERAMLDEAFEKGKKLGLPKKC